MKDMVLPEHWETYLAYLRQLPFVVDVTVRQAEPLEIRPIIERPNAILRVKTPSGYYDLYVEEKRTHLTYTLAGGIAALARQADQKPRILFALSVGRKIGRYLGEQGVNYVDKAGNCRLQIGREYMAVIEGRKPVYFPAPGRGMAIPGYRVLFTILAKPALLMAPVRSLAEAAAVSKTTAAETVARLQREGLVTADLRRRQMVDPGALLDRWMVGYETIRNRLLIGKYKTQDPTPTALEERVEQELGNDEGWAWGGGAAAMRMTRQYRGEQTVLHILNPTADLPRRLRAMPATDGLFMIQHTPAKTAFEGVVPRTVHPLLVYAELMASGNPRAREAALEIHERYLRL